MKSAEEILKTYFQNLPPSKLKDYSRAKEAVTEYLEKKSVTASKGIQPFPDSFDVIEFIQTFHNLEFARLILERQGFCVNCQENYSDGIVYTISMKK